MCAGCLLLNRFLIFDFFGSSKNVMYVDTYHVMKKTWPYDRFMNDDHRQLFRQKKLTVPFRDQGGNMEVHSWSSE